MLLPTASEKLTYSFPFANNSKKVTKTSAVVGVFNFEIYEKVARLFNSLESFEKARHTLLLCWKRFLPNLIKQKQPSSMLCFPEFLNGSPSIIGGR